ncbi:unnamed protein product [Urochloa decumbens]|uniref:Uncharacterized protein n=1 Tax=Urochloa decumbens TaxID=240449 RepID=A0ABC9CPD4_9POAL
MGQTVLLLLVLILAAASCVHVAVTGSPAGAARPACWPVALAAYSFWALASAALAVLLPRRRPE